MKEAEEILNKKMFKFNIEKVHEFELRPQEKELIISAMEEHAAQFKSGGWDKSSEAGTALPDDLEVWIEDEAEKRYSGAKWVNYEIAHKHEISYKSGATAVAEKLQPVINGQKALIAFRDKEIQWRIDDYNNIVNDADETILAKDNEIEVFQNALKERDESYSKLLEESYGQMKEIERLKELGKGVTVANRAEMIRITNLLQEGFVLLNKHWKKSDEHISNSWQQFKMDNNIK